MKSIIIVGIGILLFSCGGKEKETEVKCPCEEIVERDNKYYRVAMYKKGERTSSRELFSGVCESKFASDKVQVHREFNNGIMTGTHVEYYKNGQKKHEVIYDEGRELVRKDYYDNGQLAEHEDNQNEVRLRESFTKYGKLRYLAHFKNGKQHGEHYQWDIEKPSVFVNYDIHDNGKLILSISKSYTDPDEYYFNLKRPNKIDKEGIDKALKKVDGFLNKKVKMGGSYPKDDEFLSNLNVKLKNISFISNSDGKEVEEDDIYTVVNKNEASKEQGVTLYKISDPDGYSNLRKTPGGEILKKVYDNETFEVLGEEDKHKKVKLPDGTIGYIHISRVVLNINN